jgi:hypothetical protein
LPERWSISWLLHWWNILLLGLLLGKTLHLIIAESFKLLEGLIEFITD